MTTNDIDNINIFVKSKDGKMLVGTVDSTNTVITAMLAQFVKFIEIDADKFTMINVKDICKK